MALNLKRLGQLLQENKESPPDKNKERPKSSSDDIAIIGIAGRFGQSADKNEYWNDLCRGKDQIRSLPLERKRLNEPYLHRKGISTDGDAYYEGGFLNDIDKFDFELFSISPMEAALMNPGQRLFLETAWTVIEDGGYGGGRMNGTDTGVFLGYSTDFGVEYKEYIHTLNPGLSGISLPGNVNSIIASRISYLLNLKGPSITVDTACSSSLTAVHMACSAIRTGDCRMAIAGSVKIDLLPLKSVKKTEDEIGITSSNNRAHTFDDSSEGTGLGEGVGAVLLKPLSAAMEDGDHIYAVIKGSAVNQDGSSVGLTAPNPSAQEEVIVKAWRAAGISPQTISFLEAHGTGTPLGDPIEIRGIEKAFRRYTDKVQFCAIGSVKTNLGHLDHAAGIAGLIKAALSLEQQMIPPHLHFQLPNRKIHFENSPVYVNTRLREWKASTSPRRCGVSAFGLSGTNCHVVLEEAPVASPHLPEAAGKGSFMLALSAGTAEGIRQLLWQYQQMLYGRTEISLQNLCFTANTGRGHYSHRLAVLFTDTADLLHKLEWAAMADRFGHNEAGLFYGEHKVASRERQNAANSGLTQGEQLQYTQEAEACVAALVESGQEPASALWERLAQLYVCGSTVDWRLLYEGQGCQIISLPTYPFAKLSCWVEQDWAVSAPEDAIADTDRQAVVLAGRDSGNYSSWEIRISQVLGQVLGLREINIDDSFQELGVNSIIAVKIELDMEKAGIPIGTDELYQWGSVQALALFVEQSTAAAAGAVQKQAEAVILQDMMPFNDVFYKSCFYNSLFPVVQHFKQNLLSFAANDLFAYNEHPSLAGGLITNLHARTVDELLVEMGITVSACRHSTSRQPDLAPDAEDLELLGNFSRQLGVIPANRITAASNTDFFISDVITALNESRPVVAWVDCFYLPNRTDTYQKKHWMHTLLIYGYDPENLNFHLIEHSTLENLTYKKITLPYQEVLRAYEGFLVNYAESNGMPAYYEFAHASDQHAEIKATELYAAHTAQSRGRILEGLDYLRGWVTDFQEILADHDKLDHNLDSLIDSLSSIIIARQVEEYNTVMLFGQASPLAEKLKTAIQSWTLARQILLKYKFSSSYSIGKMKKAVTEVEHACSFEHEYYDELWLVPER